MALPDAARKQLEAAEEIEKKLAGDPPPDTSDTPPAPPADTPAPAAPDLTATPAAPPAPPPSNEPDYKQLYHSLQGKYDTEVPQLHQQLQASHQQMAEMLQRMYRLEQNQQAQTPPQGQQPSTPGKRRVTEAEIEKFGADLIDVQRRLSEETIEQREAQWQQLVNGLTQKIADLERVVGGVHQDVRVTQGNQYLMSLSSLVPDWQAINHDPEFMTWLQAVDPLTGYKRHDVLAKAHSDENAERVATIMKLYTSGKQPPAPPATPANQQQRELQRQSAPPTSKSSAPPVPGAEDGYVTVAEMMAFYDDVKRSKYVGREAERAKREAQIDAAVAAGKLRYG